jgi:hypothetical protein
MPLLLNMFQSSWKFWVLTELLRICRVGKRYEISASWILRTVRTFMAGDSIRSWPAISFGNIQSSLIRPTCHIKGKLANWSSGTGSCLHTPPTPCAMHSRFKTPIYKIFFSALLFIFAPSSPRHHFFTSHCHSLHPTTTNERTNERMVTPPFPRHVHLLLTIINFLPFASFLLLLTLDRLRRWRRR